MSELKNESPIESTESTTGVVETIEKPVENSVEDPAENPVENPIEKSVNKSTGKSAKASGNSSTVPSIAKPSSKSVGRVEDSADVDGELEELRVMRQEITRMAIDAAIKEQGLPDEFAQLVPRDSITSARNFLASEGFNRLVNDYRQLQAEKAELAQKLEQATAKLEKPIPNENAKPVPTTTTSPTEKLAPKKWGEFDDSFYQQLGATFKLF